MFLIGIEEKGAFISALFQIIYLRTTNLGLYLDRVILAVGFFLFTCAVLYVVSKRIGLLKLQRTVTAAIKAGMAGQGEMRPRGVENGVDIGQAYGNVVRKVEVPLGQPMHDEL